MAPVDDEHSTRLTPWLNEQGHIFEHSGQAPAPSKDFCQVVVTTSQVTLIFEYVATLVLSLSLCTFSLSVLSH